MQTASVNKSLIHSANIAGIVRQRMRQAQLRLTGQEVDRFVRAGKRDDTKGIRAFVSKGLCQIGEDIQRRVEKISNSMTQLSINTEKNLINLTFELMERQTDLLRFVDDLLRVPSKLPEVVKIEEELARKGIKAAFSDNIVMAKRTKKVLHRFEQAGLPLPNDIRVANPERFLKRAKGLCGFSRKNPIVFLPEKLPVEKKGLYSTQRKDHIIVHEMMHAIDSFASVESETDRKRVYSFLSKTGNEKAKSVSSYFAYYCNPVMTILEFKAEVGTGLLYGRKFDDEVMAIYRMFKGRMPNFVS